MKREIIIDNKKYTMPKLSVDDYMEYLDIAEKIESHTRYTRQDMEAMTLFVCKAYGEQFTVEQLKDKETGLDASGIIMEFQMIDMEVGNELMKKMEKIQENFQSGK